MRIPEDVSVISCDCAESSYTSLGYISVIKVPGYEMGVRSCQLLLDLLRGKAATKEVVLESVFEPRYSCAPPGR